MMQLTRTVVIGSLAISLAFGAVAPSVARQEGEEGWIRIALNGEERVGFVPRADPYLDGGPRVSLAVEPAQDVLAKDGRPVRVIEAIGWREGNGARVMAYGLSDRGATGSKRFLASLLIEWGSTNSFVPLEEMGVRGVSLTAGPKPAR